MPTEPADQSEPLNKKSGSTGDQCHLLHWTPETGVARNRGGARSKYLAPGWKHKNVFDYFAGVHLRRLEGVEKLLSEPGRNRINLVWNLHRTEDRRNKRWNKIDCDQGSGWQSGNDRGLPLEAQREGLHSATAHRNQPQQPEHREQSHWQHFLVLDWVHQVYLIINRWIHNPLLEPFFQVAHFPQSRTCHSGSRVLEQSHLGNQGVGKQNGAERLGLYLWQSRHHFIAASPHSIQQPWGRGRRIKLHLGSLLSSHCKPKWTILLLDR